jgi:glucan phosphoethanolaminetransferase (alkaline phosphatase superfamily)
LQQQTEQLQRMETTLVNMDTDLQRGKKFILFYFILFIFILFYFLFIFIIILFRIALRIIRRLWSDKCLTVLLLFVIIGIIVVVFISLFLKKK